MTTVYNNITMSNKEVSKINLQPVHIKAYRFIEKYINKNVVSPEMQEISTGVKCTLRHTYRVIDDLCALGYLEKETYRRRSIKISKPLQ